MKALGWFALYLVFVVGAAQLIGRALDIEFEAQMRAVEQRVGGMR